MSNEEDAAAESDDVVANIEELEGEADVEADAPEGDPGEVDEASDDLSAEPVAGESDPDDLEEMSDDSMEVDASEPGEDLEASEADDQVFEDDGTSELEQGLVTANEDDGVEVTDAENENPDELATEADHDDQQNGQIIVDGDYLVLPPICGIAVAQTLYGKVRKVEAGQPFSVDASKIEKISTPCVILLSSISNSLGENDAKLNIRSPSSAFTEAFGELGLFEQMMTMEFTA
jgi:anti-anti-sigma regulatory factor